MPDTVARVLSLPLQTALGQSVVVENKPGAGGAIAASVIAQSPADGYTLLLTDGPMLAITPLMMQRPAYDAAKDFAAVALVGTAPLFLAANARLRANTLAELVAQAQAAGVRKLLAVIGDSANAGSIGLHRALGFTDVGTMRSVGWKFGAWRDIVLMEKSLGAGDSTAPEGDGAAPG
ncbi:GNAT family N-acetyltransferase [Verminephrobacter sp. Larva24]|nr:GNAT family N-acetyltransferase [Verminephrobacter sp. Larva24]